MMGFGGADSGDPNNWEIYENYDGKVSFESIEQAAAFRNKWNGVERNGRPVQVEFVKEAPTSITRYDGYTTEVWNRSSVSRERFGKGSL